MDGAKEPDTRAGARVGARVADQIPHYPTIGSDVEPDGFRIVEAVQTMQNGGSEGSVPTIMSVDGYRFYFYSHEPGEPPHVHVDAAGSTMKVWLEDLGVAKSRGFRSKVRSAILAHVEEHRAKMLEAWHEHFDQGR